MRDPRNPDDVADRLEYSRRTSDPTDRFTKSDGLTGTDAEIKASDLDDVDAMRLHARMLSHYKRELEAQGEARANMANDEAMYDSDQWTDEEIAILRARGQEPFVMNVIAQSINWILGTERRTRSDYKILPRRKEGARAAEAKSHFLKYVSDVNKTPFQFSRAFGEANKAGLGWIECGVQDDTDGEPIFERYESWRNIIFDTAAQELDLSDSRFMFRTKFTDADTAKAMFPGREHIIDASVHSVLDVTASLDQSGDDAMDSRERYSQAEGYISVDSAVYSRDRVRLIECWFVVPMQENRISGGDFSGELYDQYSPGHVEDVEGGRAQVTKKLTFRMHVMIMTEAGILWKTKSPYRHNKFPFTPIWAYRKASDGSAYGVVRNMRDAQRDINKRWSKALYILSTNKTIMDNGAVDDLDDFLEEVSRPDALIVKNKGYALEINADRDLSDSHLQMMQVGMSMIQSLSGVTDEAMGRTTNATSGKAIEARQDQGAMSTAAVFDNLRLARQYHGEKLLSLVEQFASEKKQFRITNRRGSADYVTVNDGLPENDIIRTKADFIISEDDWNATLRQAQVAELLAVLMQLAPVAPQIVMVLLDLVVESMDIPSREEIVKRIRQMTGMEDPDADPNAPDPEKQARDAAKQAQQEMEQRGAMANLALLEGKAAEADARSKKLLVEIGKLMKAQPGEDLETQRRAVELAVQMLTAEPAVDTADALLKGVGFQPMPDTPPAPQAMQPAPAPVMPQEQGITPF